MDHESLVSVNGWLENKALIDFVGAKNQEIFKALVVFVKRWARNRQIYSSAFGFLGGFSWTSLVATFIVKNSDSSLFTTTTPPRLSWHSIVLQFFKFVESHPWPQPFYSVPTFGSTSTESLESAVMPIMTPIAPFRNSSKTVTKSTFQAIMMELRNAIQLLESSTSSSSSSSSAHEEKPTLDVAQLVALEPILQSNRPLSIDSLSKGYFLIQIQCLTSEEMERNVGWLTAKLVAFVGELEKCGVSGRPYPKLIKNLQTHYADAAELLLDQTKSKAPLCNFPYTITGVVAVSKSDTSSSVTPDFNPAVVAFRSMFDLFSGRGVATNLEILSLKKGTSIMLKAADIAEGLV